MQTEREDGWRTYTVGLFVCKLCHSSLVRFCLRFKEVIKVIRKAGQESLRIVRVSKMESSPCTRNANVEVSHPISIDDLFTHRISIPSTISGIPFSTS